MRLGFPAIVCLFLLTVLMVTVFFRRGDREGNSLLFRAKRLPGKQVLSLAIFSRTGEK